MNQPVQVFEGDGVLPKDEARDARFIRLSKGIDIECESFEESLSPLSTGVKQIEMRGLSVSDMDDMAFLEGYCQEDRPVIELLQVLSDDGQGCTLSKVELIQVDTIIDHDATIHWAANRDG